MNEFPIQTKGKKCIKINTIWFTGRPDEHATQFDVVNNATRETTIVPVKTEKKNSNNEWRDEIFFLPQETQVSLQKVFCWLKGAVADFKLKRYFIAL